MSETVTKRGRGRPKVYATPQEAARKRQAERRKRLKAEAAEHAAVLRRAADSPVIAHSSYGQALKDAADFIDRSGGTL